MAHFPLRHVSIRVPWHDAGWAGTVCDAPQLNGACVKLKRIAGAKEDAAEIAVRGKRLDEIPPAQWPCCVDERAMLMAPFEIELVKKHALAGANKEHYGHFRPTPQRYPAYSAGIVPFRWMMRANLGHFGETLDLDVDEAREPELGYATNWVHEAGNQKALLDGFAGHLREEASLALIYAKHVPFFEGTGRILIGVGRVQKIGPLIAYRSEGEGMEGMVWERPIQHSIRPNGTDGFLMPYHALLKRAEAESGIEIERYVAKAPEEHWEEFSYTSELVTHDGAIAALLSMDTALLRLETEVGIDTKSQREWLHDELGRLWKVRGPYPGLGPVLTAFGLARGVFVAHALQEKAGENNDPWPTVSAAFKDPTMLPHALRNDIKELAPTWKGLASERRAFLKLLSRFDLSIDQAKSLYDKDRRGELDWGEPDGAILANPYRIYEATRHLPDGVKLLTVDRGVFPADAVRLKHPLDGPSACKSAADIRRVRAFTLAALESAATSGHTLLPLGHVVSAVKAMPVQPECPVTGDILTARLADLAPEISAVDASGPALQLQRYKDIGELVRAQALKRVGGQRHTLNRDWKKLLDAEFGVTTDEEEIQARVEKAAALKELAEARFSILAGPAGAGKTTVLGILCAQPEIVAEGLLLLAPTGKARVRMQQLAAGTSTRALTLAQFLNQKGRYDGRAGRYHLSECPKESGFGTVIVDESSMLTEDMLGALFDALKGVKRYIFVGDPAQLPPIGAGRPFVDLIAKLRPANPESTFPRVSPGYAELTIERRQIGEDRPDLRLARWFSATPPSAGEDDIFSLAGTEHSAISFVEWRSPEDFQTKLLEVLCRELELSGEDDQRGFNRRLGAVAAGEFDYFNATKPEKPGSVEKVEAWQILTPLRGMPFGVGDINRFIHEKFRRSIVEFASRPLRSIPKPLGAERIVYGDKVINLSNHKRNGKKVFPSDGALGYLANGEIGVAVGMWRSRGNPKVLNVEFSSQKGFQYSFYGSDFTDEGDASLELAYALTIHKAQGSQFGVTVIVIPEAHPILSRELLYTALTRHQKRVVVMHQGQRALLKDLTAPHRSEAARRMTNLVRECRMVETLEGKGKTFLQEGLVYRTGRGLIVRSKSEWIISEALANSNVDFEYEKALTFGGSTRYPDFTIEDEVSGNTFYWEHLGMLDRAEYRKAWEKKLAWYRANGVLPLEEGGGPKGTLITTRESSAEPLDGRAVAKAIAIVTG